MNPTAPWRTFSIFIISTFSDMQAENVYNNLALDFGCS